MIANKNATTRAIVGYATRQFRKRTENEADNCNEAISLQIRCNRQFADQGFFPF